MYPNIKASIFLAWPWKSINKANLCVDAKTLTNRFAANIVGFVFGSGESQTLLKIKMQLNNSQQYLFKSFPNKSFRALPFTTPSGFNIGIILKIKHFLKCWAIGSSLVKNSKIPFKIKYF